MSDENEKIQDVFCPLCNCLVPKDEAVCPRCGNVRFVEVDCQRTSVALGLTRDSVHKAIVDGRITNEQGALLDTATSRACLLDFGRRKQLLVLVRSIAEESNPLKRKELAARLRHLIGIVPFPDELAAKIDESFELR